MVTVLNTMIAHGKPCLECARCGLSIHGNHDTNIIHTGPVIQRLKNGLGKVKDKLQDTHKTLTNVLAKKKKGQNVPQQVKGAVQNQHEEIPVVPEAAQVHEYMKKFQLKKPNAGFQHFEPLNDVNHLIKMFKENFLLFQAHPTTENKKELLEKIKVLDQNMEELAQKMQAVYSLTEPEKEEFYGHLVAWFHMHMKK